MVWMVMVKWESGWENGLSELGEWEERIGWIGEEMGGRMEWEGWESVKRWVGEWWEEWESGIGVGLGWYSGVKKRLRE